MQACLECPDLLVSLESLATENGVISSLEEMLRKIMKHQSIQSCLAELESKVPEQILPSFDALAEIDWEASGIISEFAVVCGSIMNDLKLLEASVKGQMELAFSFPRDIFARLDGNMAIDALKTVALSIPAPLDQAFSKMLELQALKPAITELLAKVRELR